MWVKYEEKTLARVPLPTLDLYSSCKGSGWNDYSERLSVSMDSAAFDADALGIFYIS